jgi:L-arabinose isomerase
VVQRFRSQGIAVTAEGHFKTVAFVRSAILPLGRVRQVWSPDRCPG